MNQTSQRHCAGTTLIEIMVAIALFAVVGAMFSQVFIVCASLTKEANFAEVGHSRWNQAIEQLRADMWRSRSVSAVDSYMIEIELADGQWIRWTRRMDDTVPGNAGILLRSRIQGAQTLDDVSVTQFTDIGWYGEFEVRGNTLVLHSSPVGFRPEMEMTLISQMQMMGESQGGSP